MRRSVLSGSLSLKMVLSMPPTVRRSDAGTVGKKREVGIWMKFYRRLVEELVDSLMAFGNLLGHCLVAVVHEQAM